MKKFVLVIFFTFFLSLNIFAQQDTNIIDEELDIIDFSEMDTIINKGNYFKYKSFKEMVKAIVTGEESISAASILKLCFRNSINEFKIQGSFIKGIIIIAILSGIIKILTDSFKSETAELGFYIGYVIIVGILFNSFSISIEILKDTAYYITVIMKSALPIMISLLAAAGNVSSAYTLNFLILFCIDIVSSFIIDIVVPFISFSAVIHIINCLSKKDILTKFAQLLKNCINWTIKGTSYIFIGLLSIQRLSAPVLNSAINKTAKSVINMVPVVGEILTGSVDSVLYWFNAIKNGMSAAVIIVIIVNCALPIIKFIVIIFVYKFIAAVIQPICDKRISECIDIIGDYTILLLGTLFCIVIMFIFSILIIISFMNI